MSEPTWFSLHDAHLVAINFDFPDRAIVQMSHVEMGTEETSWQSLLTLVLTNVRAFRRLPSSKDGVGLYLDDQELDTFGTFESNTLRLGYWTEPYAGELEFHCDRVSIVAIPA